MNKADFFPLLANTPWVNGMSPPDERGFVMLEGCEKVRAEALKSGDPVQAEWATNVLRLWYAVQSTLEEPSFNLTEDQKYQINTNCFNARMDAGMTYYQPRYLVWSAFRMKHHKIRGFVQGDYYPDAAALANDRHNRDGSIGWVGHRAKDAEGFARWCLAREMHEAALHKTHLPLVAS